MRNSGLEPECFKQTLESESSASTNSASSAQNYIQVFIMIEFYTQCQTKNHRAVQALIDRQPEISPGL